MEKSWSDVLKGKRIERVEQITLDHSAQSRSALLLLLSDKKKHLILINSAPGRWYESDVPEGVLREHAWFFGADAYEKRLARKRSDQKQRQREEKERALGEYQRLKKSLEDSGVLPQKEPT